MSMRGVLSTGSGVRLAPNLAVPTPNHGEVLLRVRLAGICDTDLQLARGYMGFRGILGHEFVAENEQGTRVTAEINNPCRACEYCAADADGTRPGLSRHCPHRTVLGILNHDGAMADWIAVDRRNIHEIPVEIDERAAVFIEPLAAALHMVEQLGEVSGRATTVLGDGKLGLLCAWALRYTGACVTWVGKHPAKLALGGDDIRTRLRGDAFAEREKYPVVVDATGSSSGFSDALRLVEPCGTVVLKTTVASEYQVNLAPLVIDEIRVIGSRCGPFEPAIDALRPKQFDVTELIEAEFPIDEAELAFEAAARPGARKILLRL